jgi:hypothetical protein
MHIQTLKANPAFLNEANALDQGEEPREERGLWRVGKIRVDKVEGGGVGGKMFCRLSYNRKLLLFVM